MLPALRVEQFNGNMMGLNSWAWVESATGDGCSQARPKPGHEIHKPKSTQDMEPFLFFVPYIVFFA